MSDNYKEFDSDKELKDAVNNWCDKKYDNDESCISIYNKLLEDIKEKIEDYRKKIVKIQRWWNCSIYYNPFHSIGYKRLEKSYETMFDYSLLED